MINLIIFISFFLCIHFAQQVQSTSTTVICEYNGHRLECPKPQGPNLQRTFIKILNAMYGRLQSDICARGTKVKNCSSSLAYEKVWAICNGRNGCFLEATNHVFGDPCVGIKKYLKIYWECKPESSFPSIEEQHEQIIFADVPETSGLAKITLKQTNSSTVPVRYLIYDIQLLKEQIQLDKFNDTAAFQMLISPNIPLPKNEICFPSTDSGKYKMYFCIYDATGIVSLNRKYFIPSKHVGQQFLIKMFVQIHLQTVKTNLTLGILPSCYPHTKYYEEMRKVCPSVSTVYRYPGNPKSIARYYFDIPGPIAFSSICLDTTHTNFPTTGVTLCILKIIIDIGTTSFLRLAEYHSRISSITEIRNVVRVTGRQFNITLYPPVPMLYRGGQRTYVDIDYQCISNPQKTLTYSSTEAMLLNAVPLSPKCPSKVCMDKYFQWNKASKAVMKNGKIQCFVDEHQQLAYLQPCLDSLKIVAPNVFYFQKQIKLKCDGGYQLIGSKKWYHKGTLMPFVGDFLFLSGDMFNQSGKYWCTVDKKHKSPAITVAFQDVTTATISLVIANLNFSAKLKDPKSTLYFKTLGPLKKEVYRVLPYAWTFKQNLIFLEFREWMRSVVALFKVSAHVPQKGDEKKYYNSLAIYLKESARGKRFGELHVLEKDIVIRSTEKCLEETTGDVNHKGLFKWPNTTIGRATFLYCPYGPAAKFVKRSCLMLGMFGANWTQYQDDMCLYSNRRTNSLKSLTSKKVTNQSTAKSVSNQLEHLSRNASSLTPTDMSLIGDTVSNLVNSNITTDQVVKDILESTSNVMGANSSVLRESQKNKKTLSKITKDIAKLALKLPLPKTANTATVKVSSKVAIQSVRVDDRKKIPILISVIGNLSKPFQESNILYGQESNDRQKVSMLVPDSIFTDSNIKDKEEKRVSFVVYKDNTLFKGAISEDKKYVGNKAGTPVDSLVIAVETLGADGVNLSSPLKGKFEHKNYSSNYRACVFWDYNLQDGNGGWSMRGCKSVISENSYTLCHCYHLTNFAILIDPYVGKRSISEKHTYVLGLISKVGIALSLLGLIITVITMSLFQRFRVTLPSKILINFCIALILLLTTFIAGVERTEPQWACKTSAALIHFFLLVTFFWMLVQAINLYLRTVKVFDSHVSNFILKSGMTSWGIPAITVAILVPLRYDDYGSDAVCIVTGYTAYGAVFAPILLILAINFVIFVMVMISVNSNKNELNKEKKQDTKVQLRISFMCSTLLGLTWGLGVLAISDARLVFQYLFCIFNSLQGFFVFYFHVARRAEIRTHWLDFVTRKQGKHSTSACCRGSNDKLTIFNGTKKTAISERGQIQQPGNFLNINKNNSASSRL